MSAPHPDAVIIHGTTSNGKVFRPSDWAERLCGILSSFNKDHRLSYHEWVHPVLLDKIRCVVIDAVRVKSAGKSHAQSPILAQF